MVHHIKYSMVHHKVWHGSQYGSRAPDDSLSQVIHCPINNCIIMIIIIISISIIISIIMVINNCIIMIINNSITNPFSSTSINLVVELIINILIIFKLSLQSSSLINRAQ